MKQNLPLKLGSLISSANSEAMKFMSSTPALTRIRSVPVLNQDYRIPQLYEKTLADLDQILRLIEKNKTEERQS